MNWYKNTIHITKKAAIAFAIAALLWNCNSSQPGVAHQERYIDIPAYFKQEIAKLQAEQPTVVKTVKKDSATESKDLKIAKWENELSSFTGIDLNKPAYQGYIQKDSSNHLVTYLFTKPDLDLNKVEIRYNDKNQAISFRINRTIRNSLYNTKEVLFYQQDSIYSLEKEQSVLLLGDKYYFIEGRF